MLARPFVAFEYLQSFYTLRICLKENSVCSFGQISVSEQKCVIVVMRQNNNTNLILLYRYNNFGIENIKEIFHFSEKVGGEWVVINWSCGRGLIKLLTAGCLVIEEQIDLSLDVSRAFLNCCFIGASHCVTLPRKAAALCSGI
jgi:hypothetical protein